MRPIQFKRVVFSRELMEKWNIGSEDLKQLIHNNLLRPYYYPPAKRPIIEIPLYYCQFVGSTLPTIEDAETGLQAVQWEAIVFPEEIVENLEKSHPELTSRTRGDEEICEEWVTGEMFRTLLQMSPLQFCNFVLKNRLKCYHETFDFGKSWIALHDYEKGFDVNDISDVKFNVFELKEYAEYLPKLSMFRVENDNFGFDMSKMVLSEKLEAHQIIIEKLSVKNKALKAKVDELEALVSATETTDQNSKLIPAKANDVSMAPKGLIAQKEISQTANAQIGKLKKRNLELTDGYEGAARLASEIGRRGPKSGNPWSESEVLTLAVELGVSIKGDCLKAFKAGMSADLVKKDAGARPTTPREESPDDVES